MTTPQDSPNPQGLPTPGQFAGDREAGNAVLSSLDALRGLEVQEASFRTQENLLVAENLQPDINVSQKMLGYVQAGTEVFSIIEATDENADSKTSRTFLAHIDPSGKGRPKLYGAVTEEGLSVGRTDDQSLSDSVSRNHFRVSLVDGRVEVVDLGSTNKTRVLPGERLRVPEAPVGKTVSAESLITRAARRRSTELGRDGLQIAELSKYENWSVKSADVRAEFDAMAEALEGKAARIYPHAPTETISDPLTYELELLDRFESKYGHEGKVILGEILNDVKRYAGFDIPKYKVSDEDFDASSPHHDELGYFRSGSYDDAIFSKQFLNMPNSITREEYDAMSEGDKNVYSVANGGTEILGPIPERILETINEVYKLTGAQVIVDDRALGEPDGSVIYQGAYQGKPIFFKESYRHGQPGYLKGLDGFGFELISQNSAEFEKNKPTETDLMNFMRETGIRDRAEVYKMIDNGELTRANAKGLAALYGEIK